jgi:hypothetical protein
VADVPDIYLGVWQRLLLRTPKLEDVTTEVYWLQTRDWHADIRVPSNRPKCNGKTSLQQLERTELLGLSRQQGFAGVTEVADDICRWHRRVDFQPPSGFNDVGRMLFENADRVLEYGVEQDYFEIWRRLPDSVGDPWVNIKYRQDELDQNPAPNEIEIGTGKYFIYVRPREPSASLASVPENTDALRQWVDFEISFGHKMADGSKRILRSTLPWREGETILEQG